MPRERGQNNMQLRANGERTIFLYQAFEQADVESVLFRLVADDDWGKLLVITDERNVLRLATISKYRSIVRE